MKKLYLFIFLIISSCGYQNIYGVNGDLVLTDKFTISLELDEANNRDIARKELAISVKQNLGDYIKLSNLDDSRYILTISNFSISNNGVARDFAGEADNYKYIGRVYYKLFDRSSNKELFSSNEFFEYTYTTEASLYSAQIETEINQDYIAEKIAEKIYTNLLLELS